MRAATKHISKAALTHNLKTLSALAPQSKTIAVVKANAYGHEASQVYDALDSADLFGVAAIEEATALRAAGESKAILLLEGAFEESDVALAHHQHFELVIATPQQLDWLLAFDYNFPRVWFKLDTGMGRLGFQAECAQTAIEKLFTRYLQSQVVLMTHFSDSDNPDRSITQRQIQRFDSFANHYPDCEQCLCNSAGILSYPEAHRDYIRPGLALYGVSPFANHTGEDHDLQPALTLTTRVSSIKSFTAGEPIGYGQTYRLASDGRIAVCEIGYADGYLRFIPNGAPIMINGREYTIAGRISMDMITVLVDDRVQVGDEVVCWGRELPVERVAESANTIPYQLLTTLTERPKKLIQ